jgi:hypothetical protein
MSTWGRLGLVMSPPGGEKTRSHAMLPTPLVLDDRIRVYFASCDADMRGRIFRVDLRRDDPCQIMEFDAEPVLDLGESDAFDAHGVNPSQIVEQDGILYLHYIGWRRHSAEIPYTLFMGLAFSDDGGLRFRRLSRHPMLLPTAGEEYFRTAGHVYRSDAGWGMLYIGGGRFFTNAAGKRLPLYSLRHTVSFDGLTWSQPSTELLSPDPAKGEIGFGRPVLWHDDGRPVIVLSVRTEIGYVLASKELEEGAGWATVLEKGNAEWDAEMTCFGAPCAVGNNEYLFYNGNQFGLTGFGAATRPARSTFSGTYDERLIRNIARQSVEGDASRDKG